MVCVGSKHQDKSSSGLRVHRVWSVQVANIRQSGSGLRVQWRASCVVCAGSKHQDSLAVA